MEKVSIDRPPNYRPASIEEAILIVSLYGTESGVYGGGTGLLIRLKNRLKQAPRWLLGIFVLAAVFKALAKFRGRE